MRQAVFEARYGDRWLAFESWLDANVRVRPRAKTAAAPAPALADGDVPGTYRELCQHLALARDRQYSPDLVDRLNQLVLRGHHVLYGARAGRRTGLVAFLLAGFPRLVRAEWRYTLAGCVAFFGPLAIAFFALQAYPDFIYYLMDPRQVSGLEEMYNPANRRYGQRDADDNVVMFAFYIWNNVKIGFQTFATGLAFGLGTLYFRVFNGLTIGAIASHLTNVGFGTPFWSFVSGHSAMELTAIALSGAAGFRLGAAVVAPGNLSRKAALLAAARVAVQIMYGAAAMFVIAAFIEGFWSPLRSFPPATKYGVGIVMWGLVIGYFLLAGRSRAR